MSQKSVESRTVKVAELSPRQIERMYSIFKNYYENTSLEVFKKDLKEKSHVFLIVEKKGNKEIQGFSTIKEFEVNCQGKKVKAYFSGDTIIEKKYWGKNSLGVEFSKFMFSQKMKNPFKPIYWNFISKGYKTYLLMANNFGRYYPRLDQETPDFAKSLIDSCGKELYPQEYKPDLGVIQFAEHQGKVRLKDNICQITPQMREQYPKIDFFEKINPGWQKGDLLVCIGEFQFSDFMRYMIKQVRKSIKPGKLLNVFNLGTLKKKASWQ